LRSWSIEPVLIANPHDPRLDDYRHLKDAELRRQVETDAPAGVFMAEGHLVVERLVASGRPVRSILMTPARWPELASLVEPLAVPCYLVERSTLEAVCGFDVHRGVLACGVRWPMPSLAELVDGARLVVALDGLTDHENVGAIFRSASALGADAVLLSPKCCDPLYRRSVRVSMGEVLQLPWRQAQRWPAELSELRQLGFVVMALTPSGTAVPLREVRFDGRPVALVLGSEGWGLADSVFEASDLLVRIPQRQGVDSLNVAAAAAIALYQLGLAD
jgi:tRNA G18 (ribose-2'-O)-methylase SpoU